MAHKTRFTLAHKSADESRFDLLIATCGYETRSTAVAFDVESRTEKVFAYTYPDHHVHAYEANLRYFSEIGEVRHPEDVTSFLKTVSGDLASGLKEVSSPRVAVDISSLSRDRIGAVVRALAEVGDEREVEVTFYYSMATFDSHQPDVESTILVNGPLDGFEGWTSNPSRPVACVAGLGFENLIALAALETLEPARTVAFIARSEDPRFHERVRRDNASLLGSEEVALVSYDLDDPFDAIHNLEGVVHALLGDYRVVLVPLGPKLFALIAILVAWEYRDSVAVWRVSADQGGSVEDRVGTGTSVALSVRVCSDGRAD